MANDPPASIAAYGNVLALYNLMQGNGTPSVAEVAQPSVSPADSIMEHWPLDERRRCLKKFRKKMKISQAQLAALAQVSQPTLSRFERGDRDLSPAAFARVQSAIVDALAERTWEKRLREIIASQKEIITLQRELLDKWESDGREAVGELTGPKDARIAELEKQVRELRELYDVGTMVALAHEQFEELRGQFDELHERLSPPEDGRQ